MIDIKNWRKLQNDITTDSLWISKTNSNNYPIFILPKRENFNFDNSKFHGIFIPEIPYQFIMRFTKNKNDVIFDPFLGSGTTKKVAEYLGFYNGVYSDLNPINSDIKQKNVFDYNIDQSINATIGFCHPPYHNIVKYSNKIEDGSNCVNIDMFLNRFLASVAIIYNKHIKLNGYVILVLGNIYEEGEEKTLGVWGKDIFCKYGFKCKSHIIKDYGETKGSSLKNYNLNYYRQLKGGYNNFYGDNIFILKKYKNIQEQIPIY